MSDSAITVKKPGKLILLGEYAVLEQAPALVATVNKFCTIKLRPSPNDVFRIQAKNLDIPDCSFLLSEKGDVSLTNGHTELQQSQLSFVLSVLKYVRQKMDKNIPAFDISIDTADFFHPVSGKKMGLGSSAALTVALLSAIEELLDSTGSISDFFQKALHAHRYAQGKIGSGVDIAASSTGGILQYRMPELIEGTNEEIQKVQWPDDLYMLSIWTDKSVSTRTMVRKMRTFRKEKTAMYKDIMNEMADLSEAGCRAFRLGNTQEFLDIVAAFGDIERKLTNYSEADIFSSVHEEIAKIVTNKGGYYKPSGAGGGDIGTAFCRNSETWRSISEAIQESPFELLDLTVQTEDVNSTEPYGIG
jgi:phosphomevalonate kinase